MAALPCFLSCSRQQSGRAFPNADALYATGDSILNLADEYSDSIVIRYARGLKVSYRSDSIHILVCNPDPAAAANAPQELVVPSGERRSPARFICTTALQLGNFEVLGLEDRIVGINHLKNLFSPSVKRQLEEGSTVLIGKEGDFDIELILAAHPDYVFVSATKHGGFESIRQSGIPFIVHYGYKETDPLGQAEWIKLVGLLTSEPRRANAVFSDIERHYLRLKAEVEHVKDTAAVLPTVASGRQVRDGWYVVGGKSYMAQLFRDAGAVYVMGDNDDSGGRTLDFEAAYARSVHADFWQIDGAYRGDYTLRTLADEDPRYATLDAYQSHRVLFCNFSRTPYRELAGVQPHVVLADFVKAFHPELLPGYVPRYYKLID